MDIKDDEYLSNDITYKLIRYNNELKFLSDEEKMKKIKDENTDIIVFAIIINIENEDLKIQAIKYLNSDTFKKEAIKSINDDYKKVQALKFLKYEANMVEIIIALKNDRLKVEALKYIKRDYHKTEISETIKDDEIRMSVLNYIKPDYYKIDVINQMSSDEKKIEALQYLDSDYHKADIIGELKDEKKRIDLLNLLNDEEIKCKIINNFKNEDNKIEALKYLTNDFAKVKVIVTLQSDKKKRELVDKFQYDGHKAEIIISMKDDDTKIELLNKIKSEEFKTNIVKSLQDDKKKKKSLKYIKYEDDKVSIIIEMKDDDIKIELLDEINEDLYKAKIVKTISDVEKRISLAQSLNDIGKIKVISSLMEDEQKIRVLKNINDEQLKEKAIEYLRLDTSKLEALKYLSDEFAKARIIGTLRDSEIIIEKAKHLKDDFAKIAAVTKTYDYEIITNVLDDLKDDFAKLFVRRIIYGKRDSIVLTDSNVMKTYCLNENIKYAQIGLDNSMTIGIEIESEGEMSPYLHDFEELATVDKKNGRRSWISKIDCSLRRGVEVVSPILTDKKEDIEDIYMICSFLEKCRQHVSERCGGHIHIGADYLKSKEAYVNLFEIWGNAEEILYKITNEKNTIPRSTIDEVAAPVSVTLNIEIEKGTINLEKDEELDEFIKVIKGTQRDNRYVGLNLLNINNIKNTIEFRIPNGTINPDTWIENIRLFGRIIQISQRLAEIEKQTEYSKEDARLFQLKNKLKEDIPEQEKMETLLELLFSEEERQVYRERYDTNTKKIEQLPDDMNPLKDIRFDKVDFKKKKHKVKEFQEVALMQKKIIVNDTEGETRQGTDKENESR